MGHVEQSENVSEPAQILRDAFTGAPLPLLVLRPLADAEDNIIDFEIVSKNSEVDALLGSPPDGSRISTILRSVEGANMVVRLGALVEEGHLEPFECTVEGDPEGRFYCVRAALVNSLVIMTLSDVTSERLSVSEHARRLAEEQELYHVTFTEAPVGIAHLDLTGAFTQVNQRLVELLGYSREELLSMRFSDLESVDPESQASFTWGEQEPDEKGRSRMERRYLRKDGTAIYTTLTMSPVRKRSGEVNRYIAIIEDVSELAAVNERLEESNRNKDEFLAVLGHELRNPLAVLRHASILLTDPGEHDMGHVVKIIDRQTKHMGRLVDDLLDIGRIVRGKFDFREEQVDMRQIVSFALDDLATGSLPSQLIEVDLQEGPLWVKGDSARLLQAVLNLLRNAVKYTPQDGHVSVRLRSEGGTTRLSVRDDGVGLEESFVSRLFLPFEQAPQDLSRSAGGLGLGLALTSQIVKHHGGRIFAESPGRGQGSTFTIELPSAPSPPAASEPPEAGPRRRLRFLVVEDNRDAAELLEMLLSARGHEVKLCFFGDRALDAAIGQVPDVVICDLGLPGKSGFEVAEKLRSDPRLDRTILLALSGYGRPEDLRRCKEVGFAAHLTKPADINLIFAEIDRLLPHDQLPVFDIE
jgi:two-component system, chemotaxis family, CheB/CheR fusion protein